MSALSVSALICVPLSTARSADDSAATCTEVSAAICVVLRFAMSAVFRMTIEFVDSEEIWFGREIGNNRTHGFKPWVKLLGEARSAGSAAPLG